MATTTALPLPYAIVEPEYNIFLLSPSGISRELSFNIKTSTNLFTGTDSPVRAASSTFIE